MTASVDKMDEKSLRRSALSLAAQLPDDERDARAIIAYMRNLVDDFIVGGQDQQNAKVVTLR